MLAHSSRDRSRSPHNTNETSTIKSIQESDQDDTTNPVESNNNSNNNSNSNKAKRENESQQRMRSLKTFIQTSINESTSLGSTYDEQVKALETACIEEYRDLSLDRIRRIIRGVLKVRKTHQSSSLHPHTASPFLHQDHTSALSTTNDRFNTNENTSKKNRPNSTSTNSTSKTSDLVTSPTSTLSAFDADFLRHAFSQQFRPSLDLSAYFSAATASNASNPTSSLFRPNFSPSNFLQSLTNTTPIAPPPPPLPPTLVTPHTHTNGTSDSLMNKSAKQVKLSGSESNSIKVLVNAYREAASYLSRSADELEQLI
ncbi:unnamed protein product [Adineta ricciae]|uniref:Uncharacterized protein n=1 Tax=Adineta ricciae TaxID=249248 RepID=A0A814FK43_ADIRI|nr:unnamed protein product [Adineta ricciae]CAF1067255.1 unnamed protein product [Adineta ricciae]